MVITQNLSSFMVYCLPIIMTRTDFSAQLRKIIICYKRIECHAAVCVFLFTCSFVVSASWRLVLGMGCAFLLWHSLGLPSIIL